MTYRERQRLADIQAAIDAIRSHLQRGDLSDGLVFDAVRIRLLEIGEAVKALPAEMLSSQPSIPWSQIARMRDHLAHRYFDTDHLILRATVENDLPELERAVQSLAETLPTEDDHEEGLPGSPVPAPSTGSAAWIGSEGVAAMTSPSSRRTDVVQGSQLTASGPEPSSGVGPAFHLDASGRNGRSRR